MSEINANFTVQPYNIDITTETNSITVTPEAINLNISTSSASLPGGNTGELQYNAGGYLDGVPNTSFANGNLTLGNVSNIRITGGTNGYVLQTDGTGNLSWTAQTGNGGNGSPGGANTQIQYNDSGSFGGSVGFTFNEVSNLVNMPGNLTVVGDGDFGNLVEANYLTGTLTTAAQPNVTSLGTLSSLTVSGNISAGNVSATSFIGAFANGNSNVSIPAANGNVNISAAGNANVLVTTGTGVNIAGTLNATGVTTLYSLRTRDDQIALGNNAQNNAPTGAFAIAIGVSAGESNQGVQSIAIGESAGDLNQANKAIAIGTQAGLTNQGANSIAIGAFAGNLNQHSNSIILNATGANFTSDGANRFYVNPVRQANTSNVLYYNATTKEISYDGIQSPASIANGSSNVNIPSINGNVNITVAGFTRIIADTSGANVTGTLGVSGNANIGNIGTARVLASANVTAPQLISNVANGTAPLVVTSTTVVANLNVATASSAATSNTANTVLIGSQPNITSVGTLSSLAVTGNVTAGNVYANSGTIGATTLTASGNVTAGNIYANSGTIGAASLIGTLSTANQTSVTLLGSQTRFTVKGNIDSAAPGNVAALALGNVPIYDIISNALSSNFYIELGSIATIGDSKTQTLIVKNNSGNTFALIKPASPQNIIQSAGTVNYYTNPAYPFTGSNIDMYEMTAIRIANVAGNPAYDLIITKTTLS